jgi:hypothetical protein
MCSHGASLTKSAQALYHVTIYSGGNPDAINPGFSLTAPIDAKSFRTKWLESSLETQEDIYIYIYIYSIESPRYLATHTRQYVFMLDRMQ